MAHGLEAEYKISVTARTPNQLTGPTLLELGELQPIGSISYVDELNSEGEASFSVEPEEIAPSIASRLKDLRQFPCEANIIRDASIIWRGPMLSCQLQGPTLTINCRGLLYYLRYMTLEADLIQTVVDQYTIATNLIDAYQGLNYGNYGIDTSGVGTSGITRTKHYFYKENQNVFTRIQQLAEIDNGFDFWIDHVSRDFMVAAIRGTDLTLEVYADVSNIINPNIFWSVAEDNVASDAIAVGVDPQNIQASIVGTDSNSSIRTTWGRATVFATAEDVTQQATIDDHATRLLASRNGQLFIPGPSFLPVAGAEPGQIEPGDTMQYVIDVGDLGQFAFEPRIRALRVTVDEEGVETMEMQPV